MIKLPFKVKSITVENTGFGNEDVEKIIFINEKRIQISNSVDCVYDDGCGGTCVGRTDEFEWSFTEKDPWASAYVLITLNK